MGRNRVKPEQASKVRMRMPTLRSFGEGRTRGGPRVGAAHGSIWTAALAVASLLWESLNMDDLKTGVPQLPRCVKFREPRRTFEVGDSFARRFKGARAFVDCARERPGAQ